MIIREIESHISLHVLVKYNILVLMWLRVLVLAYIHQASVRCSLCVLRLVTVAYA
jgi:hypothetical protein